MAKILILSLVFPPDSVSTAQIMGDLATDLSALGHQVTVLTTFPHYNRDLEAESQQPIRNLWGRILQKSNFQGIQVFHTFMPRKDKSKLLRVLAWLGFHLISTVAGMAKISKPDVILTPSPPLTIGVSAWILGRFHRAPYIYNVQEIYPDIAISMGAVRNRLLIRLLSRLESFVYRQASSITVIAPRMRQRLLEKQVPTNKIEVIPNFVDIDSLCPSPKDNEFSRQHSVHEKFVVSYAGNLGPAQGLESFIEAAELLRGEPEIHFMMMGDGILREALEQYVKQLDLPQFTFLPYQPYSLMPKIYAASDICLVPQALETGCQALPSKVYRIMACGRPVLATTELSSDLAHLVQSVGCGAAAEPGSARTLADMILGAYRDQKLWRRMGQKGRDHVVERYARSVVTAQYDVLIQSLIVEATL